MKRVLLVITLVFSLGILTASADRDYVITKNELPAKAQQFIDKHFASAKVSYVKEERDFLDRNYEIVFADGAKIEFIKNGDWVEIDCRFTAIPFAAVPSAIADYVKKNFPDAKILKIERERRDYEVKLSNKLELTFDKNFKVKNIDD